MAELETALRRAACWAPRGMPNTGTGLLAGTEGRLRFRPEQGDLVALLPGGAGAVEPPAPAGHPITRTEGDHSLAGSADLPPHLVERAG